MEIAVPYIYLLVPILSAFGVLGFIRGWAREGAAFVGVLVSWLIAERLGDGILEALNRLLRSLMFIAQGGIDSGDPASLVRNLRQVQIADRQHPEVPLAILFGLLVLAAYLLSTRFIRSRKRWPAKAGGALISTINGYLIAFVLMQAPPLLSKLVITVSLPTLPMSTEEASTFLGQYLSGALVALVGIVIVFALFSSIRAARRRGGAGWAEKRRG